MIDIVRLAQNISDQNTYYGLRIIKKKLILKKVIFIKFPGVLKVKMDFLTY